MSIPPSIQTRWSRRTNGASRAGTVGVVSAVLAALLLAGTSTAASAVDTQTNPDGTLFASTPAPEGYVPQAATGATVQSLSSSLSLTRSQILERGKSWVDPNIKYNRAYSHTNTHGTYRRDCSGFVSMAWGLQPDGQSAPSTRSIADWTVPISYSDLRPGDALNAYDNHVVLFLKWGDAARTTVVTYEMRSNGPVAGGYDPNPGAIEGTWRVSTLQSQGYQALRYRNLVASPDPAPEPEPEPTHLPFARQADGTSVAFVNPDGVLVHDFRQDGEWKGPHTLTDHPVRADSPLVHNDGHVFFIDAAGYVGNASWTSAGGWQYHRIGGKARAGSGLSAKPEGGSVTYVNTGGQLVRVYYADGAWQGPSVLTDKAVRADSPLVHVDGKVYYIDAAGYVSSAYWTSGEGWQDGMPGGGKARAGSDLAYYDGRIAYVNTSGKLVRYYYADGAWQGPAVLTEHPVRADSPLVYIDNHVFFIDTESYVGNASWTSAGGWDYHRIGGRAKAGSGLGVPAAGGSVAFVDPSSWVVHVYYSNGSWNGPGRLGGQAG